MELEVIFGNTFSAIMFSVSVLVIALALFSSRLHKISEKMEEGTPEYVRQKYIFAPYCPGCKLKITEGEIKLRKCDSCDQAFVYNLLFLVFSILGYIGIMLAAFLPEEVLGGESISLVLFLLSLMLMLTGLSRPVYKCKP